MRSLSLLVVFLTSLASANTDTPTSPHGEPVGTVAIVEGFAYAQKGDIQYTRPRVGSSVRVNEFGQYNDEPPPVPAFVKWIQNTRRRLKPNDRIYNGEIVQTAGNGWVKILFKDDSILDLGPAGVIQVQEFSGTGEKRKVSMKMLYGRIRNVVVQKLAGPEHYQIATPNSILGVRGTEFLVNVFPDKSGATQTEVICLHGQVSVDVPKHNEKGLIYHQPIVVNPGMAFSTSGIHGLGQRTQALMLPQNELRSQVARTSPLVNVHGTFVGSTPGPSQLLGTGVALRKHNGVGVEYTRKSGQTVSLFDLKDPPAQRMIASPSGNFTVPNNFGTDAAAFGNLKDHGEFTGPAPIDQLPTNSSRVTVRLNGL